jgi:mono/diheme cytochrome c family protein
MNAVFTALLLFPLVQANSAAPAGDAQAGKALWEGNVTQCRNCHGQNGEGAFGPDLAGRKLSPAQFRQALRKPWGIMPAYVESQISEKEISDLMAYFNTLPPVANPGPWRFEVPANAPRGQVALLATVGCGQCHGVTFNNPRADAGGINADFEWFKGMVYDHTNAMPAHRKMMEENPNGPMRMGTYSRSRLPESILQDIWSFAKDLGFRAPITGAFNGVATSPNGVTYTLEVRNGGLPGKGLTAEDVTVAVILPAGTTVVNTTGTGYAGVHHDDKAKADVAEWRTAKLGPKERQTFTITLSRAGTSSDNVRGSITWAKPVSAGAADTANLAPAPLPKPTQ